MSYLVRASSASFFSSSVAFCECMLQGPLAWAIYVHMCRRKRRRCQGASPHECIITEKAFLHCSLFRYFIKLRKGAARLLMKAASDFGAALALARAVALALDFAATLLPILAQWQRSRNEGQGWSSRGLLWATEHLYTIIKAV